MSSWCPKTARSKASANSKASAWFAAPASRTRPLPASCWSARAAGQIDAVYKNPVAAKKHITTYARGIELVRTKPVEARQCLKGYTAIKGPPTGEVPLAWYMLYNEFKPADIAAFQKFFDLLTEKGVFDKKPDLATMLFKGQPLFATPAPSSEMRLIDSSVVFRVHARRN